MSEENPQSARLEIGYNLQLAVGSRFLEGFCMQDERYDYSKCGQCSIHDPCIVKNQDAIDRMRELFRRKGETVQCPVGVTLL